MYPAKLQDATSIWSYAQSHTVVALARSFEDIPAIRQGIAKRVKDINAVQTEVLMDIMEQPDEIVTHVNHVWANVGPDLRMLYIQYALALLIVLLVPSLNLCGLSNSRMQQRISELFLLVNVFLGLIGTFWFRTRRRRNEIALRLAMGSTKKQIFCLLMGEGLLLLTLVTLPAMIVCYNVGIAEFTMGHTELITTWPVKWSFLRFLLGSLGAWLLIALMVVIGIWFPARQAIKIQPAEALHEE